MGRNLLDVKQASELLHLTPLQVRTLVEKQAIPCVMVGPFVRFDRAVLETWSARLASIELRDGRKPIDLTARPGEPASPERTTSTRL